MIPPIATYFPAAWSVCPSHSVCLSATFVHSACLNRSTDVYAIWRVHLWGPTTHCVRWGPCPQGRRDLGVNTCNCKMKLQPHRQSCPASWRIQTSDCAFCQITSVLVVSHAACSSSDCSGFSIRGLLAPAWPAVTGVVAAGRQAGSNFPPPSRDLVAMAATLVSRKLRRRRRHVRVGDTNRDDHSDRQLQTLIVSLLPGDDQRRRRQLVKSVRQST